MLFLEIRSMLTRCRPTKGIGRSYPNLFHLLLIESLGSHTNDYCPVEIHVLQGFSRLLCGCRIIIIVRLDSLNCHGISIIALLMISGVQPQVQSLRTCRMNLASWRDDVWLARPLHRWEQYVAETAPFIPQMMPLVYLVRSWPEFFALFR
jgi:hypothetical protein